MLTLPVPAASGVGDVDRVELAKSVIRLTPEPRHTVWDRPDPRVTYLAAAYLASAAGNPEVWADALEKLAVQGVMFLEASRCLLAGSRDKWVIIRTCDRLDRASRIATRNGRLDDAEKYCNLICSAPSAPRYARRFVDAAHEIKDAIDTARRNHRTAVIL